MSDGQLAAAFLLEKPKVISSRDTNLELMLPQLAAMLKKRGITKQLAYACSHKKSTFFIHSLSFAER